MSQKARREARLKMRGRLVKRGEVLAARETRLHVEALGAATNIPMQERTIPGAETEDGRDHKPPTEGPPVETTVELWGTEAKHLLGTRRHEWMRQTPAEEATNS